MHVSLRLCSRPGGETNPTTFLRITTHVGAVFVFIRNTVILLLDLAAASKPSSLFRNGILLRNHHLAQVGNIFEDAMGLPKCVVNLVEAGQ